MNHLPPTGPRADRLDTGLWSKEVGRGRARSPSGIGGAGLSWGEPTDPGVHRGVILEPDDHVSTGPILELQPPWFERHRNVLTTVLGATSVLTLLGVAVAVSPSSFGLGNRGGTGSSSVLVDHESTSARAYDASDSNEAPPLSARPTVSFSSPGAAPAGPVATTTSSAPPADGTGTTAPDTLDSSGQVPPPPSIDDSVPVDTPRVTERIPTSTEPPTARTTTTSRRTTSRPVTSPTTARPTTTRRTATTRRTTTTAQPTTTSTATTTGAPTSSPDTTGATSTSDATTTTAQPTTTATGSSTSEQDETTTTTGQSTTTTGGGPTSETPPGAGGDG